MTDYTPEEMEKMFGVDPSIKEANGFAVGDMVSALEDDPSGETFFEGDEGVVLGFCKIKPATDPEMARMVGNDPAGGTFPLVEFDGMDPMMCRHYDLLQVV